MVTIKQTPYMGLALPLFGAAFLSLMGVSLLVWGRYASWLGIPPLVGAGLLLSYAHYYYRDTTELYAELYQACPELTGQLDLLELEASYKDSHLRVLIYKNWLVSTKNGLRVYPLKDITWLYQHELIYRRSATKSLMVGIKRRQRHFLRELPIMTVVGETDQRVANLLTYIEATYPHIMLGYSSVNNQFFGILREENKGKPKRFWDFLF